MAMLAGVDHLGLFVLTGLLLNLTPGPDVLYIVSSGLRGGARAGCVAALGITAGCCVHIAAATVGLGALVATSATAFSVLKWVGAAYLVYVGLSALLRRTAGTALTATFMMVEMCQRHGMPYYTLVFVQHYKTTTAHHTTGCKTTIGKAFVVH